MSPKGKIQKTKLLVDKNAPILRQTAKPVALKDIGSEKLERIITKMKKALHAEEDGVAIAAPQIGVGLRMFVVSDQALAMTKRKGQQEEFEDLVFINPEIIKTSKKKKKVEEGCLSVRWLYGRVLRHEKVTIKALDEKGKAVTTGASGLLAQIFQHEVDHLNGILFIDKAENIKDMPPEPKDAKY